MLQTAGQRLSGQPQPRDPAAAGLQPGAGGDDVTPATRQVWQLRPARNESRILAVQSPYLRAFLEWSLTHVTGPGETQLHWPRVTKENAARLKPATSWLRDQWAREQQLPYGARDETIPLLGQQILYTALRDGDAFGRPYVERTTRGARRTRLQVYPGDALAETMLHVEPNRAMGITYDDRGKALFYHFGNRSEVTPIGWSGYSNEARAVAVPANAVWHFLDAARIDSVTLRCMPWCTAAIDSIDHLNKFDRAFIRSAVHRAGVGIAIQQNVEQTGRLAPSGYLMDEEAPSVPSPGYTIGESAKGPVWMLDPGYMATQIQTGTPSAQEAMVIERIEKRICGGIGVSLSTLLGDYKGQNFSSSQQGTLQEKEKVKRLQRFMVRVYYDKVFDRFFMRRQMMLLDMFPLVRPEDLPVLRNPVLKLPQYVALEKHRMIPSVAAAFREGLLTYAEARAELGQTTADLDSIIAQVKEDHADLNVVSQVSGIESGMPENEDDEDETRRPEDDSDE